MNETHDKNVDQLDDDEVLEPLRPRRKGIYILPNLFTLGALFSGFYAIVMAIGGRFEQSAYGILAAMVLDSLDGRVARMTHTQSTFGEQMDSLSDMVSFGAAPALIMYMWALQGLGKWGWFAAFVYVAGAALRLARFNTNISVVDKRFFQGVPSPAAAALVVGLVWVLDDAGYKNVHQDPALAWTAFGFTLYAGLTMVTNAPFYSFKDISFKRSVPFIVIVAIALGIAVINIYPPRVLFGVFCIYGLSGYVVYAIKRAKGKPVSVIATSTDEPDEQGLHR
ncbi:CDP-diacylglycerol--serine O-phosphatidyltransferase [Pelomonas sp. CA6]|uniref:CDP-diacylglycerol--serine O-phosphatidyltransferase n=1 Tax=Pelomonas sp. CA6 TaxID=2907999 RepID=UPI001F4AB5E2|nr:CDP-diacylglycerol--serine O-phosphatidyltransferase [Pelomonas sp. CA6]MCH7342099.1 CDP-diacylglycerol--serine O-phosphatidyltransferase [Pelomonas sp. CA6]